MSIPQVLTTDSIDYQRARLNDVINFINNGNSNISQVNTEADLPSVSAATSNVYFVVSHSKYKGPALACIVNSVYKITPLKDQVLEGNTYIYVDSVQVDESVNVNNCVYLDNNGIWQLADATIPAKHAQGIYAPYNMVILGGIAYLPGATLTTGNIYYSSNTGILTTSPTNNKIGVALNTHTLKLDFQDVGTVSKTFNGLCPQLPDEETTLKFLRQDGAWQVPLYPTTYLPINIIDKTSSTNTFTLDLLKLNILLYDYTDTAITINMPTISSYTTVPELALLIKNTTASTITVTWDSTITYLNGITSLVSIEAGKSYYMSFFKPTSSINWVGSYAAVVI